MSGLKEQYIAAGAQLIAEKTDIDKVVSGLRSTMERRGHSRLLTGVLKGLISKVSRDAQMSAPLLTLATEDAQKPQTASVKSADIKVDPSIVGGYILQEGFTRTDNSHKTKLLKWYQKSVQNT
ncbi:MAG: hypothetical protein WDZ56_01405 [Candidatus Paceibacterota bacterium]